MEKKFIHTKIIIATVAIITFIGTTGCSHSKPNVTMEKIEKKFPQQVQTTSIKTAISISAKEHGWEIVEKINDNEYQFKKTFRKRKVINGRERWRDIYNYYDVYATVIINGSKLSITPTNESKNKIVQNGQEDQLHDYLLELEQSIEKNLHKYSL